MPSKRSASRSRSPERAVKKVEFAVEETKEEAIQAANEAFGSIEEPTIWTSTDDVVVVAAQPQVTTDLVPIDGRNDISWELAKAAGLLSCYYRKVESQGDLGIRVYVKPDKEDPKKSYTSIEFKNRLSQSFQGVSVHGPVFLMPIAVRYRMTGLPLGTVNSTNTLVKKGEGGGRLCDTQISAGIGSLMGLPCDCVGGQNMIVRDAMRFMYQKVEDKCHQFMALGPNLQLQSMSAHGWNHYCLGDSPSLYWYQRLFNKIRSDEPSHAQHIKDNMQAYNGKDMDVMKRIRPHKIFAEDLELRKYFFNEPVMFRLPMKPEADQECWRVEGGEVVDLKLIPMSIQQQAATSSDSDLTMELLKPDTIESGAKGGSNPDQRLHNRYRSIKSIWIMPLDKAQGFEGKTLLELLAYLKTIDPPTALSVDEMFNMETLANIKENNEDMFKRMMKGMTA